MASKVSGYDTPRLFFMRLKGKVYVNRLQTIQELKVRITEEIEVISSEPLENSWLVNSGIIQWSVNKQTIIEN